MKTTLTLEQLTPDLQARVGGKAYALAELRKRGYPVPASLVIPCDVYRQYLRETRIDSRIVMELGRKDFQQMRWEEFWDAALRIRNLFLKTPLPPPLQTSLEQEIADCFGDRALVIRSSAPGEDGASASFAGLHNSFVNIRGLEQMRLAVRKVWASLWSDRALLYRQELGLDIVTSTMAVLIQELVTGEKSGVVFSMSPNDSQTLAIEAVHGLNQGLVDGSVEPDYWELERQNQKVINFRPADRQEKLTAGRDGLQKVSLSEMERTQPVLNAAELGKLAQTALSLERALGRPQDIEWTWSEDRLILLQARPVTARTDKAEDPRLWYLSLRRSLESLEQLRDTIEKAVIPGMEAEAQKLAEIDLQALNDQDLAKQILRRRQVRDHWEDTYRNECIPMAHGIRLFGEFYNDAVQPEDPFEFVELLKGAELRAVARNRRLGDWAKDLHNEDSLREALESSWDELPEQIASRLTSLAEEIGLDVALTRGLLLEMARNPVTKATGKDEALEKTFFEGFSDQDRDQAKRVLAVGRASYRLRDDDNISLDKIIRELNRAEQEGCSRLENKRSPELQKVLTPGHGPLPNKDGSTDSPGQKIAADFRARQLQGQPASPGLATAAARVIHSKADLAKFRAGEILVCDAIDPGITFVVPLAAGIIERRGGMLIHGAIIAREYGIPCVSGIAAAADIIATGDRVTIDGYLGLVFFPTMSGNLAQAGQNAPLRRELDDAEK